MQVIYPLADRVRVREQVLGIVIIGGVLRSLVLTLMLVPTAYLWLAPERAPGKTPRPTNGRAAGSTPEDVARPEAAPLGA